MAVVMEAISVVVRNLALEQQFPGGVAAFQSSAPNATYRSDGTISSVSFMVMDDAKRYKEVLTRQGLNATDLAIVHQSEGLVSECTWLAIDLGTFIDVDSRSFAATIAWLNSEEPGTLVARAGWRPHAMQMVSVEDFQRNYELVRVEPGDGVAGAVVAYRHRLSGKMVYIGRPAVSGSDDRQLRYLELQTELRGLLAAPISKTRDNRLASLLERATDLVTSSDGGEAGPLQLQGITARLLGRWRLAEQSFRKLTEIRPDLLDGWLELTWALATLDRLHDAEAAARQAVEVDPNSPAALGNLAAVLLQRGNPEAAFPIITRALVLDPSDAKNQWILDRVQEGRRAESAEPDMEVPWYKRLFR